MKQKNFKNFQILLFSFIVLYFILFLLKVDGNVKTGVLRIGKKKYECRFEWSCTGGSSEVSLLLALLF